MLRFQHIEFLYALFLLILIVAAFVSVLAWKRRSVKKIGDKSLVEQLFTGYSKRFRNLKFWLLFFAFAFMVTGAANLQMGDKMEKITRKGVDVMIALDMSNSMRAADVQPSRLARAKQLVNRLLDEMTNDRVGLVVFAGNAYLQMPLTVDYSAARMYLQSATPGMLPTQGTALDRAIELCQQSFNQKERKHKAIILISDGEGWDNNAIAAAKKAHDDGIVINTVSVGTEQGAPIMMPDGNYLKDDKGNVVITKMNDKLLTGIAAVGNGLYQHLDNTDEAAGNLIHELNTMQKKEFGENIFADYNSYFQYFLGIGLILLLLEFVIPETKKRKMSLKPLNG
ncbi:MAG: VWA domain-containing protein [Chitinophagaceae bacterium]|nr:MAG: VWA domain-containing protein [Chitinophagaceae bacterium]